LLRALSLAVVLVSFAACQPFTSVPVAKLSRVPELSPAPAAIASPSLILLPSPSPQASAKPVAPQPHADCSKVVFKYFGAQSQGSTVLLTWSVSDPCTPVGGYVSATYSTAATEQHWLDQISGQAGSIVDHPKLSPPGSITCWVNIGYVLEIRGAATQPLRWADNVRVC